MPLADVKKRTILPVDDYGVRRGFKKVYSTKELSAPKVVLERGKDAVLIGQWQPGISGVPSSIKSGNPKFSLSL